MSRLSKTSWQYVQINKFTFTPHLTNWIFDLPSADKHRIRALRKLFIYMQHLTFTHVRLGYPMNYKTRRQRRAAILERDRDGHRLTFHGPTRLIRYWIHPRCIKALLIQRIQPVSAGLNNVSVLQRYGMTSNSSSSDVGASSMTSNIAPLPVLHRQRSATILQRKYVKYSQVTPGCNETVILAYSSFVASFLS